MGRLRGQHPGRPELGGVLAARVPRGFASASRLRERVDPRRDGQDLRLAWEHLLAQHAVDFLVGVQAAVESTVSEKSRSAAWRSVESTTPLVAIPLRTSV